MSFKILFFGLSVMCVNLLSRIMICRSCVAKRSYHSPRSTLSSLSWAPFWRSWVEPGFGGPRYLGSNKKIQVSTCLPQQERGELYRCFDVIALVVWFLRRRRIPLEQSVTENLSYTISLFSSWQGTSPWYYPRSQTRLTNPLDRNLEVTPIRSPNLDEPLANVVNSFLPIKSPIWVHCYQLVDAFIKSNLQMTHFCMHWPFAKYDLNVRTWDLGVWI